MFSLKFHEQYMSYIEFKWHVSNENIKLQYNFTHDLIWQSVRKIGYLKLSELQYRVVDSCANVEQRCAEKVNVSLLTLVRGWEGLWDHQCPLWGMHCVGKFRGQDSLWDKADLFSHNSSELRTPFMNSFESLFPKGLSKECGLIKLGNSKVCRRHGNHYPVPFNWV